MIDTANRTKQSLAHNSLLKAKALLWANQRGLIFIHTFAAARSVIYYMHTFLICISFFLLKRIKSGRTSVVYAIKQIKLRLTKVTLTAQVQECVLYMCTYYFMHVLSE